MMDDREVRDEFTGNPWHPFLRVLRRRMAKMPPERRALPIKVPDSYDPLSFDDLFRLDVAVGRLIPKYNLTEAEIRALADWLGLDGEEHGSFLQLGTAFLAQRDSLRQLRDDPGLAEDEDTKLVEASTPRPARREPSPVTAAAQPAAPAWDSVAEEIIPGMETATTASECLNLLCRYRQTDVEWLARAVAQRFSGADSRAYLLQFRGTLPVIADRVLEAALSILNAPPLLAAQARFLNRK
jgi:hypothetical protein